MKRNIVYPLTLLSALLATASLLLAAEVKNATAEDQPEAKTVEMFAAMEAGDIEVKIIPRNSKQSTVLIENKTDKPLSIKLPQAFAGVPALAQFGGGGLGGGGLGGGGQGGGQQGFGGGMGGGGMGGGGMGGGGMGGGMFNVAPEKVGKIKVTTVCLEHGKKEPAARIPYKIVPIESFTDRANVIELCKMLGRGEIDQRAAQVTAWHLANDMSWEELARKEIKHLNGVREPYFTRAELLRALRIAQAANDRAKDNPVQSPGETEQASASR